MANRRYGGFRWRGNRFAPLAVEPPIEIMNVASGYATALYIGDPVKLISDGTIQAAAAGDTLYGIFVGAQRYWDGAKMVRGGSLPASTTYSTLLERQSKARVIPCFGQMFELDADDAVTFTTEATFQAAIGENCEWVAGTASNDESGALLDISTHATTNTLSLRITGIANYVDHDYASVGVKLLVTVNLLQQPQSGSTTGT